MSNIWAQQAISKYNAQTLMDLNDEKLELSSKSASYNIGVLQATAEYNDALLEEELSLMWDSHELDLVQLHQQREAERGDIIATQAASGTVIGEGSNADIVAYSMAQEALDTLVVRHNADIGASKISNARAQNNFKTTSAINKIIWDNEVGATLAYSNTLAQVKAIGFGSAISAKADTASAKQQLIAGVSGSNTQYAEISDKNRNNLVNGMFSSAAQVASVYYRDKETGSSLVGES